MEDHLNSGFQEIVLQVRRVSTIVYFIQFYLFHTISAYNCHWCQCKYGYWTVLYLVWGGRISFLFSVWGTLRRSVLVLLHSCRMLWLLCGEGACHVTYVRDSPIGRDRGSESRREKESRKRVMCDQKITWHIDWIHHIIYKNWISQSYWLNNHQ